jgi:amino acid permease
MLGGALVALAAVLVLARHHMPEPIRGTVLKGWTMFPPSIEYTLGTLGFALFAFAALHRWLDPTGGRYEKTRFVRAAGLLSKYSLSMYLFHHVAHLWPVWAYGALAGDTVTQYWRQALPVWATFPLAALCLAVGYALFAWIDRTKRGSAETLMRRACG